MSEPTYNVLFLCTGNSARSILAEAYLAERGAGRFHAYSAGSDPKAAVHPVALDTLSRVGFPVDGLRSKSWGEFAGADAPKLDFVFTVCDNAAGETCPVWPGQPLTAHWGIPDPAAVEGSPAEIRAAFSEALRLMRNRIELFLALPLASIDRMSLQSRLNDIGTRNQEAAGS